VNIYQGTGGNIGIRCRWVVCFILRWFYQGGKIPCTHWIEDRLVLRAPRDICLPN